MNIRILVILFLTSFSSFLAKAEENKNIIDVSQNTGIDQEKSRFVRYHYGYFDREHSAIESWKHLGGIFLVSAAAYPLTQPNVFRDDKGSWDKYKKNLGRVVFDQDEPFWNWIVHPISGSQLYLYYRANGYTKASSMMMGFASSTIFEFAVEIYSEPASVQDLYQTPMLGTILGIGLENLSMYFLNTGNPLAKFFGHLLNPSTLFWFYEGKVTIIPEVRKDYGKLNLVVEF
jgi:hypothetical protein